MTRVTGSRPRGRLGQRWLLQQEEKRKLNPCGIQLRIAQGAFLACEGGSVGVGGALRRAGGAEGERGGLGKAGVMLRSGNGVDEGSGLGFVPHGWRRDFRAVAVAGEAP